MFKTFFVKDKNTFFKATFYKDNLKREKIITKCIRNILNTLIVK